uniref:GMP reductase n=1 Tax=Cairina moschata TaxID=8855 RepID=A0A8C3GD27_CAIMO
MPRVDADLKLDFKDVLLRPKRSSLKSRSEVDLTRTFTFRNSKQTYTGIPIIVANMDTVGTFEMAVVMAKHAMFTAIHKHYSLEEWKLFAANHPECLEHVAASSGSGKADLDKLTSILEAIPPIRYICLDVANGYSEHFVEFVKSVRALFPNHTIMAGNVVTGEMVEELILSGADIIKVGIGPGSVCTTRIKTGVGYPQLSAVIECADSAHGLKGHIISDGGCSCPGDVAKAFGLRRAGPWRCRTAGTWSSPSWTSWGGCAPPAPTWELPNSRNSAGEQRSSGSPSSTARSSRSPGPGNWREGQGEKSRKGWCFVVLSPPRCSSGKFSSLCRWQFHSHDGWDLDREGCAINTVPLVQNAIASSFIVPILFIFLIAFLLLFLPL